MKVAKVIPIRRDVLASDPVPTDDDLVRHARKGDATATEALYLRHVVGVHGLLHRLAPGDPDHDDMLQDVFLEAFSHLGRLRDGTAFGGWLRGIAINVMRNRIRKRRLLRRLGIGPAEPAVTEAVVAEGAPPDVAAELRSVYRMILEIPTDCRVVLVLTHVEGMTVEEAASTLKISLSTAKRRLERAEIELESRRGLQGGRT